MTAASTKPRFWDNFIPLRGGLYGPSTLVGLQVHRSRLDSAAFFIPMR
jgi:hypothetical protein